MPLGEPVVDEHRRGVPATVADLVPC